MAVITKEELKGNPPAKAAAQAPATATVTTAVKVNRGISAHDARELGESAVKEGALERAEGHVAAGRGLFPVADPIKRIVVDPRSGKIIPEAAATEGGVVLTGAEADAYEAAHGGAKEADKAANKERKTKSATKTKAVAAKTAARTSSVSARGSRPRSSTKKARRR